MLLMKCFNGLISLILLLILTQPSMASVVTKKCGGVDIGVRINVLNDDLPKFTLFYKTSSNKKIFFYDPPADSLYVACVKNKAKHDLLLIEEICSGSSCPDTGVHAVFDLSSKKMLIKFNYDYKSGERRLEERKNDREVARLIGFDLPVLFDDKATFCCLRNQY